MDIYSGFAIFSIDLPTLEVSHRIIMEGLIIHPHRHFKHFQSGRLGNLQVIYGSVRGKQVRTLGNHLFWVKLHPCPKDRRTDGRTRSWFPRGKTAAAAPAMESLEQVPASGQKLTGDTWWEVMHCSRYASWLAEQHLRTLPNAEIHAKIIVVLPGAARSSSSRRLLWETPP